MNTFAKMTALGALFCSSTLWAVTPPEPATATKLTTPQHWSLEINYQPMPLALQPKLWPAAPEQQEGGSMSLRGAVNFAQNWKGFIQLGSRVYPLTDALAPQATSPQRFIGGGLRYTFHFGMYIEGAVNIQQTQSQQEETTETPAEWTPMMSVGYHF